MARVDFKFNTGTDDPKKDVSICIRCKYGSSDQSTASGGTVQLQPWDLDKQKFKSN